MGWQEKRNGSAGADAGKGALKEVESREAERRVGDDEVGGINIPNRIRREPIQQKHSVVWSLQVVRGGLVTFFIDFATVDRGASPRKRLAQHLPNCAIPTPSVNDRPWLSKVRGEQLDAPRGRSVEIEWIAVYSFRE